MTRLHTETFGQGKPIVLVHGWAMHSGIWRGFAKELAKYYQVTLIDLPGHGQSLPIASFTLEGVAKALVDSVADKTCCWLGWSLGAKVVLEVCRLFPERASQVAILAGNPRFVKDHDWPGMDLSVLDKFAENLKQDSQGTLLRFLGLQIKGASHQATTLRELKTSVFDSQAPDQATMQEALAILKYADLRDDFAKLTVPVAVILGELDTLVPVAVGAKLRNLQPELALSVIDRAGHVPFLSHPKAVLNAVQQFMENNSCK